MPDGSSRMRKNRQKKDKTQEETKVEEQRRRISSVPELAEVEKERNRLKRRKEYGNALRGT